MVMLRLPGWRLSLRKRSPNASRLRMTLRLALYSTPVKHAAQEAA